MVKMKNIKKDGFYISMDCYPEGEEKNCFYMIIDSRTGNVMECSLDKQNVYTSHAKTRILDIFEKKGGDLPEEASSWWC